MLNASIQPGKDKALPADRVCAAEGKERSGGALGMDSLLSHTLSLSGMWPSKPVLCMAQLALQRPLEGRHSTVQDPGGHMNTK